MQDARGGCGVDPDHLKNGVDGLVGVNGRYSRGLSCSTGQELHCDD